MYGKTLYTLYVPPKTSKKNIFTNRKGTEEEEDTAKPKMISENIITDTVEGTYRNLHE